MASNQINEVEEIIKGLRKTPGFNAYLILNNDGIVIRWDQVGTPMPYQKAVQYAHHVLDLCSKSRSCIRDLFEPQDNQVENIRLRTDGYELIAAQEGNFTLVVIQQDDSKVKAKEEEEIPEVA